MSGTVRSFLALTLTNQARARLRHVQHELAASGLGLRWEPDSKLHITVRFFGDVTPGALETICRGSEHLAAGFSPFDIVFDRVGVFPDERSPRVIHASVYPLTVLDQLGRRAEEIARSAGCTHEHRSFHPHCTLARIRERDNVSNLTKAFASVTFEPILSRSSRLTVMKSVLLPGGSQYSEIASFPFIRSRSTS